jgi:cyclin D2
MAGITVTPDGTITNAQTAHPDPALSTDRVLRNLLDLEQFYVLSGNYFDLRQTDIQPWMRKKVTTWMYEVCEEKNCEPAVFACALNCMDRFLCTIHTTINRSQLQLLGASCMFIAAKLRNFFQLSASLLSDYTLNNVLINDILKWEKMILQVLKFDIACVTPHDLLPILAGHLPLSTDEQVQLTKRVQRLTSLCLSRDEDFQVARELPSMVAAGCMCAVLQDSPGLAWYNEHYIGEKISCAAGIDQDCLSRLTEAIQELVSKIETELNDDSHSDFENGTSTPQKPIRQPQPQTPTDVQDIRLF